MSCKLISELMVPIYKDHPVKTLKLGVKYRPLRPQLPITGTFVPLRIGFTPKRFGFRSPQWGAISYILNLSVLVTARARMRADNQGAGTPSKHR
jgi:hypothetical protein